MSIEQIEWFIENDPRTYIAARDGASLIVDFTVAHPGYESYYWLIWTVSSEAVDILVQFNNGGTPHEGREPDWWLDSQYQMSHEAFIEYVQSLPKPFTAWATKTEGPLDFTEEDES